MSDRNDNLFLETALSIGATLVREALFFGGECTWSTLEADPLDARRESVVPCGRDIYGGTAGIAVVLACLYEKTGDRAFARFAIGAIRHALHERPSEPLLPVFGVYHGRLGIALAAELVGRTCNADELRETAVAALPAPPERTSQLDLDLITGAAAAIPALRAFHAHARKKEILALALAAGELLLQTAHREANGLSWPTVRGQTPNLTGYSHGASGIGAALIELFAWTGDDRYRRAGLEAFAFERTLFDDETNNWPDLRSVTGTQRVRKHFSATWCHGAPGMALARLRSAELLGDDDLAREAKTAFDTTARALRSLRSIPSGDWSLCHGVAGLGDMLLIACERGVADYRVEVHAAAARGVLDIHRRGASWPCGVRSGEVVPGAMLGLAGIAYFFLRLTSSVPSLLMPARFGE
jgi:lantibiotic modifying enzyme